MSNGGPLAAITVRVTMLAVAVTLHVTMLEVPIDSALPVQSFSAAQAASRGA